jgi:hypothetical protein
MRRAPSPLLRTLIVCASTLIFATLPLRAQQRQALPVRAAAPANAAALAKMPAARQMNLSIALPMRNQAQLQTLIQQQQNPSSPEYKHFLTVQEFTARFGPTEQDYAKVVSYLKTHGMTVTRSYPNRMLVNVRASVAAVNQTFRVSMHTYQHPTENRQFFAPNIEPTIEPGLPILSVEGLSDLNEPQPMLKHAARNQAQPEQTGSGQGGQFLGSDMRAAYAPGIAAAGQGQTVGLIELGPYNLSDVQAYFTSLGQPLNVPIYNVLLGVDGICAGTPSNGGCDDGEEVIDIEQAISMAPQLSALVVYEAYGSNSDALTAFTQAASDDIAKQLSLSFGWGGTPSTEPGYEQIFMELAAQGQNVFVASGDGGASVGTVGYPGNSPNIVDVGGTDLTTAGAGGPWQSETGWVGSGGGWSTDSPIPSYQVPVITTANQGSKSYRNIPDVAMEANTDNYFCANGSCQGGIGGTSLSAPRWAGYLALANQQADGVPIGFLNPIVYSLGQTSKYASVFHDITTGNDFNQSSPNLFSATTGYDLVTGWGSPQGQGLLDLLAPANPSNPNFTVSATPSVIKLTPGESGTATVSVSATNGFNGTVTLSAAAIGAPAGVTATLDNTSISGGSGTATLTVTTTSATPGGSLLIAINANSGTLAKTAYVSLALPDFGLTASASNIYLNQSDFTTSKFTVSPENGFAGKVNLDLASSLPDGAFGFFLPPSTKNASTLVLAADDKAFTSSGTPLTITGKSGSITQTESSLTLFVSAAVGNHGSGQPVNLSSDYNAAGVYTDGSTFTNGGLDGGGFAYSASLVGRARVLNDVQFRIGPPNTNDVVYAAGQTIALPAGYFNTLQFLGTGVGGNQVAPITVTYTDGSTSASQQTFHDWFNPGPGVNEGEAVAMAYRNTASGSKSNGPLHLYSYTLLLTPGKIAKSFTLPKNRNVLILAATLAYQPLGTQVNLAGAFNAEGIYTDGTTFAGDGGLDAGGAAFSGNVLGDASGPSSLVVDTVKFNLAKANQLNAVYGAGQQIALPQHRYTSLRILGTGVQGDQADQTVTVTYTDGTTSKITQSFSDWYTPQNFARENEAVKMPYRDFNDGSEDNQNFNLYQYVLPLDPGKTVKSVALPQNRYVVAVAMTLVNDLTDWGWRLRNGGSFKFVAPANPQR